MSAEERINLEVMKRTLQMLIGAVYLHDIPGTVRDVGAMVSISDVLGTVVKYTSLDE